MMKKIVFVLSLLIALSSNVGFAQGIDFQEISFVDALKKAKEQDKLIFIDFYTAWCGPCKKLAKETFTQTEVGNYYNSHFINLTLDAEKEGLAVAKKYKVTNYPTLLYIDGEGKIVSKNVGFVFGDTLIQIGKSVLSSLTSQYSLQKLTEEYPKMKGDEAFAKLYMLKMQEFGQNEKDAIENWLNVQTEWKENSPEMVRFLLKNQGDLLLGGKAEQILNGNYDTFLSSVSENEKNGVKRLKIALTNNTLKEARHFKKPELMRLFIQSKREINASFGRKENLSEYEIEYQLMSNNVPGFKKVAENYVDSLMRANPPKEVHQSDKVAYDNFEKLNKEKTDATTQAMRASYREGISANRMVKSIVEVSELYLKYADAKENFEVLNKWFDYCNELIPDKFLVDNQKANMLYIQGDTQKAIVLKEKAIEHISSPFKKKVNLEYELGLMKEGKPLNIK